MKYKFVELVVILFTFIQDVIKLFLLILPEKNIVPGENLAF